MTQDTRQLLTECVQLAALGGAAGLVLTLWGTDLLRRIGPPSIPHLMDTRIDVPVLVFTTVIVLLTGTLFGLTPVFAASKVDPNQSLKEGGVQVTQAPVRHRLRGSLMVSVQCASDHTQLEHDPYDRADLKRPGEKGR